MNILLVNDDGINSERLRFTKEILKKFGKVIVVAPSVEQSGKSSSITIGDIKYYKVPDPDGGVMFSVEGTPADCVTVALYGLEVRPDLVVSGVNKGFNLGVDTMYSGTVGAAINAKYHGFNAIAISGDPDDFKLVEYNLENVMNYLIKEEIYLGNYIINVNFPTKDHSRINKVRNTHVYGIQYKHSKDVKAFSEDSYVLSLTRVNPIGDLPEDSDIYAVKTGDLSLSKITPHYKFTKRG